MASQRSINSLPLQPQLIQLLLEHGFRVVADLKDVQPFDLVSELRISNHQALEILNASKTTTLDSTLTHDFSDNISSAKDLLSLSVSNRPIITFCREMDLMLGGGVNRGLITEFCGVPGIGKTQIGIQLALTVQIPEIFNGCGGESVYIDSEGSFMVERVVEMANELSTHLKKLAKLNHSKAVNNSAMNDIVAGQISAAEMMSTERFLEGIKIFRCHDQNELVSTINNLKMFLESNRSIHIVIIDSIAFHFRQDLQDLPGRNRILANIAQDLNQLAHEYQLAVVVINHVTTKIVKSSEEPSEDAFERKLIRKDAQNSQINTYQKLVPALGDAWSHSISQRVMLHWDKSNAIGNGSNEPRLATLVKSPSMPNKTVQFIVSGKGIRDATIPVSK